MTTTFQLNEAEINDKFLIALKTLFKDQNLTLTVEVAEDEQGETEYLLSSPVNRARLLQSIQNVREGKNLIETNVAQLNALIENA